MVICQLLGGYNLWHTMATPSGPNCPVHSFAMLCPRPGLRTCRRCLTPALQIEQPGASTTHRQSLDDWNGNSMIQWDFRSPTQLMTNITMGLRWLHGCFLRLPPWSLWNSFFQSDRCFLEATSWNHWMNVANTQKIQKRLVSSLFYPVPGEMDINVNRLRRLLMVFQWLLPSRKVTQL